MTKSVLQSILCIISVIALIMLGTAWALNDRLVQPGKTLIPVIVFVGSVVFIHLMGLVYRMVTSSTASKEEPQ